MNTPATGQPERLERDLSLLEATSLNMTFMVGIGPFIVIPFIIRAMGGPQCIFAWVLGAILALLDGCVWAELGAAMPQAGGSYVFLREAYGAGKFGRLMVFFLSGRRFSRRRSVFLPARWASRTIRHISRRNFRDSRRGTMRIPVPDPSCRVDTTAPSPSW